MYYENIREFDEQFLKMLILIVKIIVTIHLRYFFIFYKNYIQKIFYYIFKFFYSYIKKFQL